MGVPRAGGGPEQLVLFLVLKEPQQQQGVGSDVAQGRLLAACQEAIRHRLNPLFKVHGLVLRAALPRNASNKLLRRVLRDELLARPRARM